MLSIFILFSFSLQLIIQSPWNRQTWFLLKSSASGFCLIFCQFQPNIAHKSVGYKTIVYFAKSKFSTSLVHKKGFCLIWQWYLSYSFCQERQDTSFEIEWIRQNIVKENYSHIHNYTLVFISNTFIIDTRLKLAKNWIKAKQHPEAVLSDKKTSLSVSLKSCD